MKFVLGFCLLSIFIISIFQNKEKTTPGSSNGRNVNVLPRGVVAGKTRLKKATDEIDGEAKSRPYVAVDDSPKQELFNGNGNILPSPTKALTRYARSLTPGNFNAHQDAECEYDFEIKGQCDEGSSSCRGRCGNYVERFDVDQYYCQCDQSCGHYDDCCSDYSKTCLNSTYKRSESKKSDYACRWVSYQSYVYLKLKCLPEYRGSDLERSCMSKKTILERNPVYDETTGDFYNNIYCAQCNNIGERVRPWVASVQCGGADSAQNHFQYINDKLLQGDINGILDFVKDSDKCSFGFLPPTKTRSCVPTLRECKRCQDTEIARLCSSTGQDILYIGPSEIYHNENCMKCNRDVISASCLILSITEESYPLDPTLTFFSLQLLLDRHSKKVVRTTGLLSIDELEFNCATHDSCRASKCPNGYIIVGDECLLDTKLVHVVVTCQFTLPNATYLKSNKRPYFHYVLQTMTSVIRPSYQPLGLINHIFMPGFDSLIQTGIIGFEFNTTIEADADNITIEYVMTQRFQQLQYHASLTIEQPPRLNVTYTVLPYIPPAQTRNPQTNQESRGRSLGGALPKIWLWSLFIMSQSYLLYS